MQGDNLRCTLGSVYSQWVTSACCSRGQVVFEKLSGVSSAFATTLLARARIRFDVRGRKSSDPTTAVLHLAARCSLRRNRTDLHRNRGVHAETSTVLRNLHLSQRVQHLLLGGRHRVQLWSFRDLQRIVPKQLRLPPWLPVQSGNWGMRDRGWPLAGMPSVLPLCMGTNMLQRWLHLAILTRPRNCECNVAVVFEANRGAPGIECCKERVGSRSAYFLTRRRGDSRMR